MGREINQRGSLVTDHIESRRSWVRIWGFKLRKIRIHWRNLWKSGMVRFTLIKEGLLVEEKLYQIEIWIYTEE